MVVILADLQCDGSLSAKVAVATSASTMCTPSTIDATVAASMYV